jgi:hypothetical protein
VELWNVERRMIKAIKYVLSLVALIVLLAATAISILGMPPRNACVCDRKDTTQEDHCSREVCKCVCRFKTKFPVDCAPKNERHCHCAIRGSEKHPRNQGA